mgnify:CR=1 FL=1
MSRTRALDAFSQWSHLHPAALLLSDRSGRILAANRRALDLLGAPVESVAGKALQSLVDGEPEALSAWLRQCARTTDWTPTSLDVRRPAGDLVACRAAGARGAEDTLFIELQERAHDSGLARFAELNARLLELSREVGRRRRAEALLADEKRVLESIARGEPLTQALQRLVGEVLTHGGCTAASILLVDDDGRRLRHAASAGLSEKYDEAVDGLEIGPTSGSCGTAVFRRQRVVVRDTAEDPLWADFRELARSEQLRACWAQPIFAPQGEVLGSLALYHSSPRGPGEEEIVLVEGAAYIAGLAVSQHRSRLERSRLLAEARRGLVAAEAAVEAKDRFLAMLGHELRNPLAAMLNATTALQNEDLPSGSRGRLLSILERQGSNLSRIVEDLLDVARIDSDKLTLRPEIVDLETIVQSCAQILEPIVEAASMRLVVTTEPTLVHGDPTRLEQILRNLCDNAIKYGAPGVTLRVAVDVVRQPGERGRIVIEDDGSGIDPDFLANAFEPFAQAPQNLVRSAGGVGLGLALVKRLVELHGGEISIHSEGRGRGTRVVVLLPLARASDQPGAAADSDSAPHPATVAADEFSGLEVLVVEDQPDARLALEALLELWGCHTSLAEDGHRGVEIALQRPIRLALIDVGLPGLSGYEVARRLRERWPADGDHGGPKLVAMTGYGQPEDRLRALEAGFDEHVVKPMGAKILRQLLSSVLEDASRSAPTAAS